MIQSEPRHLLLIGREVFEVDSSLPKLNGFGVLLDAIRCDNLRIRDNLAIQSTKVSLCLTSNSYMEVTYLIASSQTTME
jgi:hypothetical protein